MGPGSRSLRSLGRDDDLKGDLMSTNGSDKPNDLHPRRARGRHPRRARPSSAPRAASASSSRICATRPSPAIAPDGNCRVCMVEIEGERVLAASCIRTPTPGMKVKTQTDRAKNARRMVVELLVADQPALARAHDPDSRALEDRQAPEDRGRPLPARRSARARPQPSGDGGQSRRLHPLQSVRPRLPRGAGQRRDRHGRPRPPRQDRVRLRRPDGRTPPASPAANACRPARPAR